MPVAPALTAELKKVVLWLQDDLRERVEKQPEVRDRWVRELQGAINRERTAMSWQAWRDDRVTQAAVAWVLTTVFIRFSEDNRLLKPVWISGPEERRQEALDAELAYFRLHPEHTSREWLEEAVTHLLSVDATRSLVESHSPLWSVSPSGPTAQRLVNFWRQTGEDGSVLWDFADPALSTRFLGDLYQDLSDYAKKTYALLQTPEFVEEFILDQTMEPALAERPLEGFMLIDPTCGSGHFLLGAFARLNDRWAAHAPGLNVRARVDEALKAIHGVDLNPFAVAVARFRLIVAALQACCESSLESAPAFPLNIAAGDSLLYGVYQGSFEFEGRDFDAEIGGFSYTSEDAPLLRNILKQGRYDLVIGNPPYITVNDPKVKSAYKEIYETCYGHWTLSAPFIERFFNLCKSERGDLPAGWMGQINSNAFMKRDFGQILVEKFLTRLDLRAIIDCEGAWIPGHNSDGTPTVIITGRNRRPTSSTLRLIRGKNRRESRAVGNDGRGPLWRSIVENLSNVGFENSWIEVVDVPRSDLASHPWSLEGGGAHELLTTINQSPKKLGDLAQRIGLYGDSHADEVFFLPPQLVTRLGIPRSLHSAATRGDAVRDWTADFDERALLPKQRTGVELTRDSMGRAGFKFFWPLRTELWSRGSSDGGTYRSNGKDWLDWHQLPEDKSASTSTIGFSEVASVNHFAIDFDSRVFNRTAPIIKLSAGTSEAQHLTLLGLLNSSTICFWLKQSCKPKGGAADVSWLRTYQFNSTRLKRLPLPSGGLENGATAKKLVNAAASRQKKVIEFSSSRKVPSDEALQRNKLEVAELDGTLVSYQEELDWETYASYGISDEPLTYDGDDLPKLALGERAFEIALARSVESGEQETVWFSRRGSTPIIQIPTHWPAAYRTLVQRRLDLIERDKFVRLLESPENKRHWATEPWGKQVKFALRTWLLDRLEDRKFWFDSHGRPTPISVGQLADQVARDSNLVSGLALWSGVKDEGVAKSLTALLIDEAVPYLAAFRLKDSGLRKRESWEQTWDLQRREDAGERVGDIPVPTKYGSGDFRKASWWEHRGKLDIPKERFVLYPDAGRETDPTLLLGWAGWDHTQQALALATIIDRLTSEGAADVKLVPLVAGLAELQPWVTQWHNELDATFGINMADFLAEQLRERAARLGQTVEQIRGWRPVPTTRGRKAHA